MEKGITAQYIDEFGKRRAFKKNDYWFFCEPLYPLPVSIEEYKSNKTDAIEYCKKYNGIVHLDTKKEVMGVYFQVEGIEYYCPIQHKGEQTPFEKSYLDLRDGLDDRYEMFVNNKKLATLIKAYSISYYARHSKLDYVISKNHAYDLSDLKNLYREDSSMFIRGKLVYPSEKIAESCSSFIKAMMINDPYIMDKIALKKRPYIASFEIDDYKKYHGQLLISQNDFFKSFILSGGKNDRKVLKEFDLVTGEPYHLKNPDYFEGKLLYIQNVYNADDKGYERAKYLLDRWKADKTNLGYFSDYAIVDETPVFYDFQKDKGDILSSFVCKMGDIYFCVLSME